MSNLSIILTLDIMVCEILLAGFIYKLWQFYKAGGVNNKGKVVTAKYILFTAFLTSTFVVEYSMYSLKMSLAPGWLFNFMLITKAIAIVFTILSVLEASGYMFGDKPETSGSRN